MRHQITDCHLNSTCLNKMSVFLVQSSTFFRTVPICYCSSLAVLSKICQYFWHNDLSCQGACLLLQTVHWAHTVQSKGSQNVFIIFILLFCFVFMSIWHFNYNVYIIFFLQALNLVCCECPQLCDGLIRAQGGTAACPAEAMCAGSLLPLSCLCLWFCGA